jgi:hypothetical protein
MTKKELKARANHLADAVKVIIASAKLFVAILTPMLPNGKGRI